MHAEKLSDELASLTIERTSAEAKRSYPLRWLGFSVALSLGGIGYVAGRPHLEARVFKAEVETTEILSLSPATISTEVTAAGYVVPQVVSRVGSKVQGRVERVLVAEGQRVKKGDQLIALDETDQRNKVRAGAARLLSAEAQVERKKAQYTEGERKLKRERALAEQGVTTRASLEDLAARVLAMQHELKAAQADRAAAAAELEALEATLRDLTIAAPIDGTILTKPPQVGEVVSPTSTLIEIADFASLMVEAEVPEARLSKVRPTAPCEIMLDADPSRRHRGLVREISPLVNRAKATVMVKVAFAEAAEGVLPNMAARAFVLQSDEHIGEPPKTVVPSSALVERNGAAVVFVIDGDRVRMEQVAVGAAFGPGLLLIEGPRPGTRLVKNPPPTMFEGHRIKERKQ